MARPVQVGLIGAGLMGSFHAETLAFRARAARLVAIADPAEAAARRIIEGVGREDVAYQSDYRRLLDDPAIEAVVVATPARFHADIIVAAAEAGKPVFCEKPLAHTLEEADRCLTATRKAGVALQIGFQRRFDLGFARARRLAANGDLGAIHLLRSITRDPAVPRPEGAVPWAIFLETLIHDFDVLRWLADSEATEVFAVADALVWPKGDAGMLDTALVTIHFAGGALATADASFQSAYGYDVRAEVFGSGGMATAGNGALETSWRFSPSGVQRDQAFWFKDLFGAAYVAEIEHFAESVRTGTTPAVTGEDGRASLCIALAAIESVKRGRPITVADI